MYLFLLSNQGFLSRSISEMFLPRCIDTRVYLTNHLSQSDLDFTQGNLSNVFEQRTSRLVDKLDTPLNRARLSDSPNSMSLHGFSKRKSFTPSWHAPQAYVTLGHPFSADDAPQCDRRARARVSDPRPVSWATLLQCRSGRQVAIYRSVCGSSFSG